METPILFIVFNRLHTAKRVFDEIKKQKPKYLYIAADGPRPSRLGEDAKCNEVREYVLSQIDWDCEYKTLFREKNLGCGKSVSGAINWFFENVDKGIILEDDCLPHPDFFGYCTELLNKYEHVEDIRMISASCYETYNNAYSYYFSATPHIGGWATWKRTWLDYDFTLNKWTKKDLNSFVYKLFLTKTQRTYIRRLFWKQKFFYKTKYSHIDTWDYQFDFCNWFSGKVSIMPCKNLITNIGFGNQSTHTSNPNDEWSNLPLAEGTIFPMIHPTAIVQDKERDLYLFNKYVYKNFFYFYIHKRIRYILEKVVFYLGGKNKYRD